MVLVDGARRQRAGEAFARTKLAHATEGFMASFRFRLVRIRTLLVGPMRQTRRL
jgi:hypothetical protein